MGGDPRSSPKVERGRWGAPDEETISMPQFWILRSPVLSDRKLAWWNYKKGEPLWLTAPTCTRHRWRRRQVELKVLLKGGPKQDDFVWTWYSECLIQERLRDFLQEQGFSGFRLRNVQASFQKKDLARPRYGKW